MPDIVLSTKEKVVFKTKSLPSWTLHFIWGEREQISRYSMIVTIGVRIKVKLCKDGDAWVLCQVGWSGRASEKGACVWSLKEVTLLE